MEGTLGAGGGNSALVRVREHVSANGGHCRCLSHSSCWPTSGRNHSIGHAHTLLRDEGNRKRRELALLGASVCQAECQNPPREWSWAPSLFRTVPFGFRFLFPILNCFSFALGYFSKSPLLESEGLHTGKRIRLRSSIYCRERTLWRILFVMPLP